MTARETFGPTLRIHRERRGMTLAAVAEITKISPFLLIALERGDVSRWPGGIYRRSFIRAYAAAVGLPPEPTLREFVHLFPEPGQDPAPLLDADDPRRLRLTLVAESRWKTRARLVMTAALDGAAVLLIGYGLSAASGLGLWMLTATAGFMYHALGTALLGQSPVMWCATSGVFTRSSTSSTTTELALIRRDWLSGLLTPTEGIRGQNRNSSLEPSI
jgi:transcriptional regulator with XRE-family HTH domain